MSEASNPRVVAVVAMARNRVIGNDGGMPWRMPSDLKRYRRLTMGKPMIMGRKTLESIGRVLDGRDTIVLSRSPQAQIEGARLAGSPEEAMAMAAESAAARGSDEIVIAGGAEIYGLFLDRTERLYVTIVEAEAEGDTLFPPIDADVWAKVHEERCERGAKDSADSRFEVWERR